MTTEAKMLLTYLKEEHARTNSSSFSPLDYNDFPNYEKAIKELISKDIIQEHIAGISFTDEYRKTL